MDRFFREIHSGERHSILLNHSWWQEETFPVLKPDVDDVVFLLVHVDPAVVFLLHRDWQTIYFLCFPLHTLDLCVWEASQISVWGIALKWQYFWKEIVFLFLVHASSQSSETWIKFGLSYNNSCVLIYYYIVVLVTPGQMFPSQRTWTVLMWSIICLFHNLVSRNHFVTFTSNEELLLIIVFSHNYITASSAYMHVFCCAYTRHKVLH